MRIVFLISSCSIMIVSVLMAIKLIKEKKSITNPDLIVSIITFLIALRMVYKMFDI